MGRLRRVWWRERALRRLVPAYLEALREIKRLRREVARLQAQQEAER